MTKDACTTNSCRFFVYPLALLFVAAAVGGCASHREMIQGITTSTGEGVFQKIDGRGGYSPGFADLYVQSSIKTHNPGRFAFDDSNHGKPSFALVLNIDGQALSMTGAMKEEPGGYSCETDPEAGDGVRYSFHQGVRLKPGKHTIKIAIPDDGVALVKEVSLKEGAHRLNIKPVYGGTNRKRRIGFSGETSFYEGLKTVHLVLDGKEM